MDGDWGYHLMSTNVLPGLQMLRRDEQPPHRKQLPKALSRNGSPAVPTTVPPGSPETAETVSASSETDEAGGGRRTVAAATTCSTTNPTPAASPIIPIITVPIGDNISTTVSKATDTNTNTSTSPNPDELDALQDTATTTTTATTTKSIASTVAPITTGAVSVSTFTDLGHVGEDHNARSRRDGHPHECGHPASSEQSTATAGCRLRRGSGGHRPRLFGRPSRRHTTPLTTSPIGANQGLPVVSCSTTPAALSHVSPLTLVSSSLPDSASSGSREHLHSDRHIDDTAAARNRRLLLRLCRRNPTLLRSSHQLTSALSSSELPLISARGFCLQVDRRISSSGSPILYKASSLPIRKSSSSTAPCLGSSALAHRSGVMASNEHLLSTSAEKGGILTAPSLAPSATSRNQAAAQLQEAKSFIVRNGRTYINEPGLPYPLPVDLPELHRQSLRTLLMFQLFGGPILSSAFASKPPTRVLDVGCGAGFWSMMCHRYFAQHGHANISFTGLDIVPLGGAGADASAKPDKEMDWQFVQHDIRQMPWPFIDGEFDLIMVKDMAFASSFRDSQLIMEEYLRVLKPGGVLEYWETDSTIRMLRPHAPKNTGIKVQDDDASSDGGDDEDNAERMGAYVMTTNTPISAPLNAYLVEYNGWSSKALEARGLSAVPCTLIGAYLLQEAESLTDVQSKRLAVPLSEIRWEREGVGGVVTKDGKSYIDSQKGKLKDQDWKTGSPVTPAQSALRKTALETTVSYILALEPLLREVSGKSQEEWDTWAGKMTVDLLREGGTSWGECLEVGVWTSRKRHGKI